MAEGGRVKRLTLLLAGALAASPALADPFDGSDALVCGYMQTYECNGESECKPGDADDVRIPDFVRIDFDKKTITALDEERRGEVTTIRHMERSEGRIILQGVEAGRGWSLLLSEATGNTVLTVSADQDAFVVFGECTRP
jgi:hypothetical protein